MRPVAQQTHQVRIKLASIVVKQRLDITARRSLRCRITGCAGILAGQRCQKVAIQFGIAAQRQGLLKCTDGLRVAAQVFEQAAALAGRTGQRGVECQQLIVSRQRIIEPAQPV